MIKLNEIVRGRCRNYGSFRRIKINDSFGLPEVYENADKMEQLMDRQAFAR
jgi:hypothetical protein